jgi:hypothetical protein
VRYQKTPFKKMNALKLISTAILLLPLSASAQKERFIGMSLHATSGIKQVNAKSTLLPGAINPSFASTLGAGPSWNINRAVIGSQFYYSTASTTKNQMLSRYTGFNNNVYVGYQVVKSGRWQITPIVGFGKSRNQILLSSTEGKQSPLAVNNNVNVVHTAIRIEHINKKGNDLGLKLGYNISTSGNSEWKSEGSKELVGASDNLSGFFLQLNVGGLIKMKTFRQ